MEEADPTARPLGAVHPPLTDEQLTTVDRLLESLDPAQVVWLSRFLLGTLCEESLLLGELKRTPQHDDGSEVEAAQAGPYRALVLFGTNTGHAEQIARALLREATTAQVALELRSMADYEPSWLRRESLVLIVVSTHGDGDPPDAARRLYDFLHGPRAPQLAGLRYAVLGLGDRTYTHFCKTGRSFDERLAALGAARLLDRVDCDLDYEPPSSKWIAEALGVVKPLLEARAQAAGLASVAAGENGTARAESPRSISVRGGLSRALRASARRSAAQPSQQNPFMAAVLENLVLSGRDSGKEVRHIELSIADSGIHYEPGDSLGVVPQNDRCYVRALIEALALDEKAEVDSPRGKLALSEALETAYEVRLPTKSMLRKYAGLGAASLAALVADEARTDEYLRGRELLDVVREFRVAGLTAPQLVSALPRLEPRRYSIASCMQAFPDEVHLMVAVVRYRSHDRNQRGVASGYLADEVTVGQRVPVYVSPNQDFRLPADPKAPVVMIGPGTGVAPFRAFMQRRQAAGARGPSWLFFGDRTFLSDFSYQLEWQKLLRDGVLSRLNVAFSRDGAQKRYVQHELLDRGRDVYDWLERGGHLYVCGDRLRMAADVDDALVRVVSGQRAVSLELAQEYVAKLKTERRYHRDVY